MTEENGNQENTTEQVEIAEADERLESIASGEEWMDLRAKVGPPRPSLLDRCRKLLGLRPSE